MTLHEMVRVVRARHKKAQKEKRTDVDLPRILVQVVKEAGFSGRTALEKAVEVEREYSKTVERHRRSFRH